MFPVEWFSRQVNADLTTKTYDADVTFVRLRMLLLRGLGAAAELCSIDSLLPSDESNENKSDSKTNSVNGSVPPQHPLISLENVSSELKSTLQSAETTGMKPDSSVSI